VPSTILIVGTRPSVTSVRWTTNGNTLPERQHSGTVYGFGSAPPWLYYVLSTIWFWGPGFLLAVAVLLQARPGSVRMGWGMSVLAAVAMSLLSLLVLWSFSRQGDVHWSLWAMWIAAGLAAGLTIAGTLALAPSRRLSRSEAPFVKV
jgi:hypothetical protein